MIGGNVKSILNILTFILRIEIPNCIGFQMSAKSYHLEKSTFFSLIHRFRRLRGLKRVWIGDAESAGSNSPQLAALRWRLSYTDTPRLAAVQFIQAELSDAK
jgi:hypothetical protein